MRTAGDCGHDGGFAKNSGGIVNVGSKSMASQATASPAGAVPSSGPGLSMLRSIARSPVSSRLFHWLADGGGTGIEWFS